MAGVGVMCGSMLLPMFLAIAMAMAGTLIILLMVWVVELVGDVLRERTVAAYRRKIARAMRD